jgi:hypothetical protein
MRLLYIRIFFLVAKIFLLGVIMVCFLYQLAGVAKIEHQKDQTVLKASMK